MIVRNTDIGRFADVSRRKKSLDVGYVRVFSTGINSITQTEIRFYTRY